MRGSVGARRGGLDESQERADDEAQQTLAIARVQELVARALDGEQLGAGGDEGQRPLHFVERAKAVAGAVHEEGRRLQAREVLGAELIGTARRMKRI